MAQGAPVAGAGQPNARHLRQSARPEFGVLQRAIQQWVTIRCTRFWGADWAAGHLYCQCRTFPFLISSAFLQAPVHLSG